MNGRDPYLHPTLPILRNKLGIFDADRLDQIERRLVTQRIAEGAPTGRFDLVHLRAIHRHLFQDIYDWAGEIRTVEIAKEGHQFQFRRFIAVGVADIHRRLVAADFLRGLERPAFAEAASAIIGDLNYVHPFRDGNGRTQLQYLDGLALRAGHPLDLSRLSPTGWLTASRAAHDGDYRFMAEAIARAASV
ncbi:protein involved in cell division [Caulobacter sp. AP07]|uniref:Fic/DOC family protein n=1 Tax=Caulobacter sp. AP07 TaxID=1144304 RepID=UPI00027201BF|nr:Fic family protein [Caulobacter sp. AP07]EJL27619.1 protein involved in cell division [Caulobacter sp. AP07]